MTVNPVLLILLVIFALIGLLGVIVHGANVIGA